MSEWEEEIERINHNLRQIRRELNDMSHTIARLEESVEWIKAILKWGLTLLAFLIGLSIGL